MSIKVVIFFSLAFVTTSSYADTIISGSVGDDSNQDKRIEQNFERIDELMTSINQNIEIAKQSFAIIDDLIKNGEHYAICQTLEIIESDISNVEGKIQELEKDNSPQTSKLIKEKTSELDSYNKSKINFLKTLEDKKFSCNE